MVLFGFPNFTGFSFKVFIKGTERSGDCKHYSISVSTYKKNFTKNQVFRLRKFKSLKEGYNSTLITLLPELSRLRNYFMNLNKSRIVLFCISLIIISATTGFL